MLVLARDNVVTTKIFQLWQKIKKAFKQRDEG